MNENKTSHKGTFKRLVGYLVHDKVRIVIMIMAACTGVGLIVFTPKYLAQGTNILFEGLLGTMLKNFGIPEGTPMSTLLEMLKASGRQNLATLISNYNVEVGKGIDWSAFLVIVSVSVCLYVVALLFRSLQSFMMSHIASSVIYRMRQEIESKIERLPLSYFDRIPRGEVMSRATNDMDNIAQTLNQMLAEFFFSSLQFIVTVIMMLSISPMLTLIAMSVIIGLLVVVGFILGMTQSQYTQQWEQTGKVNSHVEEMFSGHMIVRAYGHEHASREEFEEYNAALHKSSFKASFFSSLMNPLTGFAGNASFILVAIFGGIRVINGTMTLGDLQAFTQYCRQTSQPLGQLASMGSMLQSALSSCSRVFEFLDEPEETLDDPHTRTLEQRLGHSVQGEIEFDHVAFSYDPEKPLITDLSVVAKPGQTVAIVGPTGAGKTTLVNLLMRFYDINGGHICIDGVDTMELTRHDVRSHFGMVLQDTWLFEGTIRDNLFYGVHDKSAMTDERMIEAARATHVDEFVRRLPQGYDTILSDDTSELSQGEKQLLTICRAYLSEPDILILDEATSSVDTRTEMRVQTAMNALRKGRTSFVIAHRLSTIRDADVILVVNHGNIVEQGSHDELLERGGAYAALYNSQFTGAARNDD